jgi:YidC/Oxa1 family membrane protein insertase
MDKRSLIFVIILSISFFAINQWLAPTPPPPKQSTVTQSPIEKKDTTDTYQRNQDEQETAYQQKNEEFYVLENDYIQVVFSTLGGAISEINLPFNSKDNKTSVVLPIQPDLKLSEISPINDLFPLHPYFYFDDKTSSKSYSNERKNGGYFPLLRRAIYNNDGSLKNRVSPQYYAGNLINENAQLEKTYYKVSSFDKNSITLIGKYKSQTIEKTYSLPKEGQVPYCIDLSVKIDSQESQLWLSSGVPEVELMPNQAPIIKYRYNNGKKYDVKKISLPKSATTDNSISPDWVSNSNGFFGIILDQLDTAPSGIRTKFVSGTTLPTRYSLIDQKYDLYPEKKYPGYEIFLPLGDSKKGKKFRIFAGPYQNNILAIIDSEYSNPLTGYTPDYEEAHRSQGFFSFFTGPFSKLLFFIMSFFHSITNSWGISIILLTIALKVMLYPLNKWSIKSAARMQELGPLQKKIKERYKHDPKKQQAEMVKLYKEMGGNPLTGCLPMMIPMPFLFGMFALLRSTFELRGVSFIPGWIDNLTAPDVLFSWTYPIFFLGTQFHILPLVLAVLTLLQQKITTKLPTDGSVLTEQQKQQRMMMYLMPALFIFITYNLASGLNIYWICSTFLGIGQQMLMKKHKKKLGPVLYKKKN